MSSAVGSLSHSASRTGIVLLLRLLILAATLLVLTRLLGPAGFGAFAGVAAVSVILGSLASFGTHLVVTRDAARCDAGRSLGYAALMTTCASTGLFALFMLIATWVIRPEEMSVAAVLVIGAADILAHPILQFAAATLLGRSRVALSQLMLVLPLALRLLAALVLIMFEVRSATDAYAGCYLLAVLVALAVSRMLGGPLWPRRKDWRRPNVREWREAAGFAALNLTAVGPGELDKVVSVELLPPSEAGIYSTASRVVGALVLPVAALMLSALPRLFAWHADRDRFLLRAIFLVSTAYGFAAGLAIHVAAPWIALAFGSGFESVEQFLHILAFAVPAMSLRLAGTTALMGRDLPWWRAAIEAGGLTVLGAVALGLQENVGTNALPVAVIVAEWGMAFTAWSLLAIPQRVRRWKLGRAA